MVVDVRLERKDCLKTIRVINQEIHDEIIIDYNSIINYLKTSSTVKGVGNTPLSFLKVEYVGVNNGRKIRNLITEYRHKIMVMQKTIDRLEKNNR